MNLQNANYPHLDHFCDWSEKNQICSRWAVRFWMIQVGPSGFQRTDLHARCNAHELPALMEFQEVRILEITLAEFEVAQIMES